jgi:hypothetical protein
MGLIYTEGCDSVFKENEESTMSPKHPEEFWSFEERTSNNHHDDAYEYG